MTSRKKKIAIAFNAGRKTVCAVANMLAESILLNEHLKIYDFTLIISYDPTFCLLSKEDFKIKGIATEVFNEIIYSGPEDYFVFFENFGTILDKKDFDILFKPRGYCTQKNRSLLYALIKKTDYILLFDDDEYFIVPIKDNNHKLNWLRQDVVSKHIQNLSQADITNGRHAGYFSPIPPKLGLKLDKKLREKLGKTLSIGNEIINKKTFNLGNKFFKCGRLESLSQKLLEIQGNTNSEPMTGGNLGIKTESIKEGKIPPYFNPLFARGEDLIFSMQLNNIKVVRVPVYTFHDPFQQYLEITEGIYPLAIKTIQLTPETIDRFCKASLGWVSYAPFFLRMSSGSENEYRTKIAQMKRELVDIGEEIDRCLKWDGFRQMASILEQYNLSSKKDLVELSVAREAWHNIVNTL